jgi:hypothetical protein
VTPLDLECRNGEDECVLFGDVEDTAVGMMMQGEGSAKRRSHSGVSDLLAGFHANHQSI